MSRGLNKAQLIGRLGQDPEVRQMPSGQAVANISVATSESWKDKETGEKKERTEWHRVTMYGRLAEIAGEYLKKGAQVYIEGRLHTREWEKDGIKRFSTEIICEDMQMLGSARTDGGANTGGQQRPQAQSNAKPAAAATTSRPAGDQDFGDDDIPF